MVKWMNSFLRFYSVNGAMDAIQVADTINLIHTTHKMILNYFSIWLKKECLGKYSAVWMERLL